MILVLSIRAYLNLDGITRLKAEYWKCGGGEKLHKLGLVSVYYFTITLSKIIKSKNIAPIFKNNFPELRPAFRNGNSYSITMRIPTKDLLEDATILSGWLRIDGHTIELIGTR